MKTKLLFILTVLSNIIFHGNMNSQSGIALTAMQATTDTVWPGDCNYDGVANNIDFLYLGMAWNDAGNARISPSILWTPQYCTDWANSTAGINHKYSDSNGDGFVDLNDTNAIIHNYHKIHALKLAKPQYILGAPDLYLVANVDTVGLKQTVNFQIMLGTSSLPIDSIYGIAFTFSCNANLTYKAPAISYPNSWYGSPSELISFEKSFYSTIGSIDLAVSRKTKFNAGGFGQIGNGIIITIDNLGSIAALYANLSNVTATTISGATVTLNAIGDSVVIDPKRVVTTIFENNLDLSKNIQAYPNPSANKITISLNHSTEIESIKIHNTLGQLVYEENKATFNSTIDVLEFPAGLYVVSVKSKSGIGKKTISVIH